VEVPLASDASIVRERPPVEFFLVHHFFEILRDGAHGIDANQGKRLAF
jgi:hypothetical protein